MKTLRHLSLLIILCCLFTATRAQYVTIPDTGFVTYLQQAFPGCMIGSDFDTTCMNLNIATVVTLENTPIADLTGIEYFHHLLHLTCKNTGLQTIPSFPASLETIDVSENPLVSLPDLPAGLKSLDVYRNQLSALPAFPATLNTLICTENPLTILPALPTALVSIEANLTALTSLPALPDSLTTLICRSNALTSLPALPAGLKMLDCTDNYQLTVLPALPAGLEFLQCGGGLLSGLPSPLPDSLTRLYINFSNFTTLPALPPNLTLLNVDRVPLTSLPALPASLTTLEVHYGALTTLPTLPAGLSSIICPNNRLTTLPALPDSLRTLKCSNNLLTGIPVLPSSLKNLLCDSNLLTSLPALNNIMFSVDCSKNPYMHCLPRLTTISYLGFDSAAITCLPNYGNVGLSNPPLSAELLCDPGNAAACQVRWNIKGNVYNDINGNCSQQPGSEKNIPYLKVSLLKNGSLLQQTYTGGYGAYSFDTDTGNFVVTVDTTNILFDIICPVSRFHNVGITNIDSFETSADFAMQCKPGTNLGVDISVESIGSSNSFRPARPVLINGANAYFYSSFCSPNNASGQLTVILSGPVSYAGPAQGALTPVVNGDTLTYTVADWSALTTSAFFFIAVADTMAQVGQQICFKAIVTAAGDVNAANDTATQCYTIVNSYDPNDKQVSPVDVIDNTAQWLTYTIRFQNTGTAPAIDIYVIDTLNAALDISTFQLLDYSHPPQVQVFNTERRARFTFTNINLADSLHNEPESHGYIQYRVKTLPGLNCGTQLGNAAHIYFDFNAPVATNAALNTIYMSSVTNLQNTICSGEQFNFNGQTLTDNGDYIDTLQASFACDSIVNLHLEVLQGVEVIVDTAILSGTSLVLPSGTTVTAPGNYTDTLQTSFGCDSIITTRLSVVSGIENLATTATMQLYPNPAQDVVMINLSDNLTGGTLTLSDVTGRSLNTISITSNHNQLNTGALASGVYLVTAVKEGVRVVQRVTISH